jgi:hypothetical protein
MIILTHVIKFMFKIWPWPSFLGQKPVNIIGNLLLQNRKCQRWTKSIIFKRSFLQFIRDNFLWPIFFPIMLFKVWRYEKSQFQCSITSLLLIVVQKKYSQGIGNHTKRIKKCFQKVFSNLTYDLKFLGHFVHFWLKCL